MSASRGRGSSSWVGGGEAWLGSRWPHSGLSVSTLCLLGLSVGPNGWPSVSVSSLSTQPHRTVARYELKRALEGQTRPTPDAWYRSSGAGVQQRPAPQQSRL